MKEHEDATTWTERNINLLEKKVNKQHASTLTRRYCKERITSQSFFEQIGGEERQSELSE